MVRQLGKLFEKINEFNRDQETKKAYKHIYTSVSKKFLNHIQHTRHLHATESNTSTGLESSLPISLTYLSRTEYIASPPGPSTLTALPIDDNAEHTKQSFTTCFNDYYYIYKGMKDST
jgi:hypothetical protein